MFISLFELVQGRSLLFKLILFLNELFFLLPLLFSLVFLLSELLVNWDPEIIFILCILRPLKQSLLFILIVYFVSLRACRWGFVFFFRRKLVLGVWRNWSRILALRWRRELVCFGRVQVCLVPCILENKINEEILGISIIVASTI